MTAPVLTGLRGIQHAGYTVSDMEQALRFFVDVIGCVVMFSVGPIAVDAVRSAKYNVPQGATLKNITMLQLPHGANLELFEYDTEHRSAAPPPKVNDRGGHHLAFLVDDLARTVRELSDAGIQILGDPSEVAAGPLAGLRWVYALTPWGLHVEFVELPDEGVGHERSGGARLYRA